MGEWDFYQNIIELVGLKKYEVAARLGFSEVTLSRWFREKPTFQRENEMKRVINELLVEKQAKINNAINRLANK